MKRTLADMIVREGIINRGTFIGSNHWAMFSTRRRIYECINLQGITIVGVVPINATSQALNKLYEQWEECVDTGNVG